MWKLTAPDVACLQEIKTQDEGFPAAEFEKIGYGAIWHGQKSFNGVAILGGFQRSENSQEFQGGDLMAIMGGCEIDLRQAAIAADEAAIDTFALWGGIKIKVPDERERARDSAKRMLGLCTKPEELESTVCVMLIRLTHTNSRSH